MLLSPWKTAAVALFAGAMPLAGFSAADAAPQKSDNAQSETAAVEAAYDNAKKMESKGLKRLEDATDLIKKGQKSGREGQKLLVDNEKEVADQRQAYVRAIRGLGLATTSKQVRKEMKMLDDIADKWEKAEDRMSKGEKLIKDGEKDVAEGQSQRREAETMIAKARLQMGGAESRISQTESEFRTDGNGFED
ncbi:hypothetical protein [Parvularcula sp. LCG005]|uniref:hypothetical protein n=1 Tax=Parvularcula sp. LCG005 TaxID=3078805 RepID=UPI00294308BD|nr:hypothetical protein [Parvularcula sp. LCG005]WOI53533.1 hypothetical protein RUI03_00730 [Parvularcula sp. LCG005]